MGLAPGDRFGHYEIHSTLGAGGMGEVYQARDTVLGRDVAIKVLPDGVADDPERVARFQREAQLLASLNHPGIAAIYGLAESQAARGLVLELVDGPTLADRIAAAPLEVDEALDVAEQIAAAVAAAHERGVVHRDLKPANIKVTPQGRVKVLDFGLAKMLQSDGPAPSLSLSPTLSVQATMAGVILGTAAYMSPEQARGKPVDRRTDVWAFGCVLFEMLTGRQAFEGGETLSDVVAAILTRDPPLTALPDSTPAGVRKLLRRCLKKDPAERLHDMADVRLEIVEARQEEERPAPAPASRASSRVPWAIAAGVGVVATVLVVLLARGSMGRAPEPQVFRSTIPVPAAAALSNFGGRLTVSPDGRSLALIAPGPSGADMLWVRRLDLGDERALAGTEGVSNAFWSPDSRHLAFVVKGQLKRVEAAGGPVLTLCDGAGLSGGSWNQEDVILFPPQAFGPLLRVSASGGTPVPATTLAADGSERGHHAPVFLPDGRRFLFRVQPELSPALRTVVGRGTGGIQVGALGSDERTPVIEGISTAYYASGHLVFLRGATLLAQPFDLERLATTGEAVPIVEQILVSSPPAFAGAFSVSQSGVLVYQAGAAPATQLVWLDRSGQEVRALSEAGGFGYVQISPDGRYASVSVQDSTTTRNRDIWLYDLARDVRTRFTTDPRDEFAAVWAPDSRRLVFAAGGQGGLNLHVRALSAAGSDEAVTDGPTSEIPVSWSPDGRQILYMTPSPINDIFLLPLGGDRRPVPFAATRFNELAGEFSPDGAWIAFSSNETGRPEIYVAPVDAPGSKVPVSRAGGELPRWRRDGRELFFIAPDGRMMAAPVRAGNGAFDAGAPQPLFPVRLAPGSIYPYAVAADGQRFLVNLFAKSAIPVPISLVVNWPESLNP